MSLVPRAQRGRYAIDVTCKWHRIKIWIQIQYGHVRVRPCIPAVSRLISINNIISSNSRWHQHRPCRSHKYLSSEQCKNNSTQDIKAGSILRFFTAYTCIRVDVLQRLAVHDANLSRTLRTRDQVPTMLLAKMIKNKLLHRDNRSRIELVSAYLSKRTMHLNSRIMIFQFEIQDKAYSQYLEEQGWSATIFHSELEAKLLTIKSSRAALQFIQHYKSNEYIQCRQ